MLTNIHLEPLNFKYLFIILLCIQILYESPILYKLQIITISSWSTAVEDLSEKQHSLTQLINAQPNRRISETDALHCLRCICAAFQPMFQKGIIHRYTIDQKEISSQKTLCYKETNSRSLISVLQKHLHQVGNSHEQLQGHLSI